jgi:hypothetical protein
LERSRISYNEILQSVYENVEGKMFNTETGYIVFIPISFAREERDCSNRY